MAGSGEAAHPQAKSVAFTGLVQQKPIALIAHDLAWKQIQSHSIPTLSIVLLEPINMRVSKIGTTKRQF